MGRVADGAAGLVAHGVIALSVPERAGHGMGLAAIGVGVAVVAGNVADGVVGIRVIVRPGAGRAVGRAVAVARERRGQPAQPVVLEALLLVAVDAVRQGSNVAGIIVSIAQVLPVRPGAGRARAGRVQPQTVGLVAVLQRQAVGTHVEPLLRHLPRRVVGRGGHVLHARAADLVQLPHAVVAVADQLALLPAVAAGIGERGALVGRVVSVVHAERPAAYARDRPLLLG